MKGYQHDDAESFAQQGSGLKVYRHADAESFVQLYRDYAGMGTTVFCDRTRIGDFDFIRHKRWDEFWHDYSLLRASTSDVVIIDRRLRQAYMAGFRTLTSPNVLLATRELTLGPGFSGETTVAIAGPANTLSIEFAEEDGRRSYVDRIWDLTGGIFEFPESDLTEQDVDLMSEFREVANDFSVIVLREFRENSTLLSPPSFLLVKFTVCFRAEAEAGLTEVIMTLEWNQPVRVVEVLTASRHPQDVAKRLRPVVKEYKQQMSEAGKRLFDSNRESS